MKEFYVLPKLPYDYKNLEPAKFDNKTFHKSLNMHIIDEVPLRGE